MKFERQKNENERLQHEIERIENELFTIRKTFIDVENLSEEDIEKIYRSIENKSSEKMNIYKLLNENLWVGVGENIKKMYLYFNNMPLTIQKILHSTEFILIAGNKEADFSEVILNFAKVMEIILDENISKSFVRKIEQKCINLNISDRIQVKEPNIKNLFKQDNYESKSISLGGWYYIIEKYINKNTFPKDKITEQFIQELKSMEIVDISNIFTFCGFVGNLRNGIAHTKIVDWSEVNKHMDSFRETINGLSDIFISVKIH